MPISTDWPLSGYGPPPEPPPRDYSSPCVNDDRLRTRFEACRSGMQELEALRSKHALMIQNLKSRLPVIPGCLDDVLAREKKKKHDVILDRFSLQSVDSGISSQNTMNSTRCSSPETDSSSQKTSFENSTINYSTFRKLSLEKSNNMSNPHFSQIMGPPPIITSRSCHRGAWKNSPKKIRPKSMFEQKSEEDRKEFLFEKPPIDLRKTNRNSAFSLVQRDFSNMSLEDLRTSGEHQNLRKNEKTFRANVVYLSSNPITNNSTNFFSPSRSPPVRRHVPEIAHAKPCKIRSPVLKKHNMSNATNNQNVYCAKPISVRPSLSASTTWLQSQPL
ncbi:unnamed protein product [Caenorhabditis angaria]|uniref:Uncharacterized protein n=1 Tax=Caenorhabditis angaria TaxID=860376 RepID=A0A9P1I661_9PELO|nr:unnamed protein product [Caenorhabditis angaria]